MDLTKFLGQDSQEQSAQRLSKEEYAAQKKQEREEIWGMIDGKAQEVFQNGDSLKGFLDFMGLFLSDNEVVSLASGLDYLAFFLPFFKGLDLPDLRAGKRTVDQRKRRRKQEINER